MKHNASLIITHDVAEPVYTNFAAKIRRISETDKKMAGNLLDSCHLGLFVFPKKLFFEKIYVCLLLEQALSHLVEATAPGEELVGCALGDKSLGVEASGFQGLDALVDAVGILLVATAFEDILHCLGILDVLRHVHTT